MAELSGLSVKVSAATADFRAGMSRAEEAAQDLSLSLRRLGASSSAAERDIDSVGRSAATSAAGMTTLQAGTEGLNFSMSRLSGTILLSLVPALAVLSGALVPLVVALGGFIGVAGSIAGIGLVATIGAIATHTEELKEAFGVLLDTVKTEFAPVFDVAAEVLFSLMGALTDTISELVPAEGVISRLAGNFAQLGHTVIDALPAFVDMATTLALQFLPPFVTFMQDIMPRLPGMIQHMGDVFGQVLPILMDFGRAVGDVYPALLEFGFAALDVVASSLGFLGGVIQQSLEWFNALDGGVQDVLLRLSLVAPVITVLASLLSGLSAPILGVIAAVGLLAAAWHNDVGNIREIVANVGAEIQRIVGDRIPKILNNARAAWETWKPVIEPLLNLITSALGVVAVNAIDSLLTGLNVVLQLLSGDFSGALNSLQGLFRRVFGRVAEFINKFTGGALQGLANAVIDVVNSIGGALEGFAEFVGEGDRFNFEQFENINIGTTPFQPNQTTPPPQRVAPGQSGVAGAPQDVRVTVEGDTGVVKDVAAETINEEQRSTRRRQGRGTGPI